MGRLRPFSTSNTIPVSMINKCVHKICIVPDTEQSVVVRDPNLRSIRKPSEVRRRQNSLDPLERLCYYRLMRKKRGGQPGNKNAIKHGFYSPSLSPEEISSVWHLVNVKSMDPELAVIRLKLVAALARDPGNHRLIEDAAKVLTRRHAGSADAFDRREFRKVVLEALESSVASDLSSLNGIAPVEPIETGQARTPEQDESSVNEAKPRNRTNRDWQARPSKQDESSVL